MCCSSNLLEVMALMLQAWRVAHPPKRGLNCIFSRPLVHVGFLKSWLAGGFNDKVVSRVVEIVKSCNPGQDSLCIYITGKLHLMQKPHSRRAGEGGGCSEMWGGNSSVPQAKHPLQHQKVE